MQAIVALATQFGRYGYRRITALFKADGWRVNHKRVARSTNSSTAARGPESTGQTA